MRRLLVINPNTTESVSQLLQRHAQEAAGEGVEVRTVTARFGAPYIADEASFAVAGHATLDAWATALVEGPAPDAVLIGCFGDPGLLALRDSSATPVTGLAEGAVREAARTGRFAIVTGGVKWRPMLQRLVQQLDLSSQLAEVMTVAPTGVQMAADPEAARALLTQACQQAARLPGVRSVILGGAGLAGIARQIQPEVPGPVIDSVRAGVRWALHAAPAGQRRSAGFDVAWGGLSGPMQAMGRPLD